METTKTKSLAAKKLAIQMVIEAAEKGATNPHFGKKYADLAEVLNTIKKAMTSSQTFLLIEQFPHTTYSEPGKAPTVTVTTRITDVDSGELESFDLSSLPAQDTPQAIGSTITYLRRYSLMPVFGVVPEDDDGNSASGKKDDMDQRRPDDRKPSQASQQTRQPPQRQAAATTAPAATNPRPTGRTMRGRAAPTTTAPTEPPLEDVSTSYDLLWEPEAPAGGLLGTELIQQPQYDDIRAMCKVNNISRETWARHIKVRYDVDGAMKLTMNQYMECKKLFKEHPDEIGMPF